MKGLREKVKNKWCDESGWEVGRKWSGM